MKFGPVIRFISDFAVTDKYLGAHDTGIEQRSMGEHRIDFMELFHKGEYMEMPLGSQNKMKSESIHKIRISTN